MFSIFEFLILVFPKHINFKGVFEVIHEEIMQIGKSRTSEDLWRLWEDQEWRFNRHQKTLQREEFCSRVPRQVISRQKPKTTENWRNWTQEAAPCTYSMEKNCHAPRALLALLMLPEHLKCSGHMRNFMLSFGVRNSHYKYQPSSFKIYRSELWQFKRKAILELQRSFYLLFDYLGYVFIFSNLFFVTMCI